MSTQNDTLMDLSTSGLNNFHIVGIGGAGMSAIAHVLSRMGKTVTGSDLKESQVTQRLESQNIKVHIPHIEKLDSSIDAVLCSSAIPDTDPEIREALEKSIPVYSRADILQAICANEKAIGIAGSHGKTTTTSMATQIARTASMNPSFMIGGDVNEIGTNAAYNEGSILIVEADESDQTFLKLPLVGGVITNIENDHLENYGDDFENLQRSFYQYANNINGPVVVCVDEPNSRSLAESITNPQVITVGKANADWVYEILSTTRNGISARFINKEDQTKIDIELAVPGEHNIKNAICAFALMNALGVDIKDCAKGLSKFGGVSRRFQFRGESNGIVFVDDYAHLPTEIQVTLTTALNSGFNNVISVFQPHRYSRTNTLYRDFAEALKKSNTVIVCEIYSAGEEPIPGVTSALVVDELIKLGHRNVYYPKHIEDVINLVIGNSKAGDLVLTMGAGDITMYPDLFQNSLEAELADQSK